MWFSLFSTVLILAITFYQGLQGLFTGLINCIMAILAAALAFGFYENVYFTFLADRQPEFGRAVALLGIFILTLLILRLTVDALVKGNVTFHVYVDRAGGGIFGFFTAMIVVGMLTSGFQLLPFPPTFMGFARFRLVDDTEGEIPWSPAKKNEANALLTKDWSKIRMVRQNTWLNSGGFASSLASHLSTNALRGRDDLSFGEIHPDVLAEAFHAKTNPLGPSRLTAKKDSLQLAAYWDLPPGGLFERDMVSSNGKSIIKLKKADAPESGDKDIVIRTTVRDARDEGGDTVRFTPAQVRLFVREKQNGPLKAHELRGINDDTPKAGNSLVHVYPGEPIARSDNTQMDFVFRVPEGSELVFLEFKQDARSEISPSLDKTKEPPPPIGVKATPTHAKPPKLPGANAQLGATPKDVDDPQYGRTHVLGPADGLSIVNKLPFDKPLTNYGGGGESEVRSGEIKGMHGMVAELDKDWQPAPGSQPPADHFEVPADKRILQVSVKKLQAGSTYGKALSFAIESVEDFYLITEGGKEYRPVGVYAMAEVGGKKVFEMTYLNDVERDMARIPKFSRIKGTDLQGEYALVYIFHVPPGTKPRQIHTGRRPVDLTGFSIDWKEETK